MQNRAVQLFPPELRTASIVPRWSVVWTLTRDTVANHSYYVALYARNVARLIGWNKDMASLMFMALTHDLDETISGDIVSPVKSEILDEQRYADYIDLKMHERLPDITREICNINTGLLDDVVDEIWTIIKVADRLDALLFIIGERRMGNTVIEPRTRDAESRLQVAFMELPKPKADLDMLWNTAMRPAIRAHKTDGGNGV